MWMDLIHLYIKKVNIPGLSGQKSYELNVRSIMTFRKIGKGLESMKTFSRLRNMTEPINIKAYNAINDHLLEAYLVVADNSICQAATEVKEINEKQKESTSFPGEGSLTDCTVSLDLPWGKRRHDSQNDAVTAINWVNEKVIDYHVISKKFKVCEVWNRKKGSPEYDAWKAEHNCSINHKGSAGSVESAGAIKIFQRSINNHKLRCNNSIGDDDSCSFNKVVQSKPYGETL